MGDPLFDPATVVCADCGGQIKFTPAPSQTYGDTFDHYQCTTCGRFRLVKAERGALFANVTG